MLKRSTKIHNLHVKEPSWLPLEFGTDQQSPKPKIKITTIQNFSVNINWCARIE